MKLLKPEANNKFYKYLSTINGTHKNNEMMMDE